MKQRLNFKWRFIIRTLILLVILIVPLIFLWQKKQKKEISQIEPETEKMEQAIDDLWEYDEKMEALLPVENFTPPPPPDMQKMKRSGCIADGLLNGETDGTDGLIKLINRSNCYYLHRSIETWLQTPDFEEVKENRKK